jgi:hypothetical protein
LLITAGVQVIGLAERRLPLSEQNKAKVSHREGRIPELILLENGFVCERDLHN